MFRQTSQRIGFVVLAAVAAMGAGPSWFIAFSTTGLLLRLSARKASNGSCPGRAMTGRPGRSNTDLL
ncbi:MAG: hypothetical protein DMG13_10035 [Acidobacteria bacterium]|nr:MAG: hypothetical protein DMG13_10035 [Acidobacteriota bacterium]